MKTQKSSDNDEITPSKKVLKQARLPFMVISDVSPKSASPLSRKRKLSAPEPEPVTKVGKITKENDLADSPVIIIDDDSKEALQDQKVDKLNPYVKLVNTAFKKKLQKAKSSKKKNAKKATKSSKIKNADTEPTNKNSEVETEEEMEVDEVEEIKADEKVKDAETIALENSNCAVDKNKDIQYIEKDEKETTESNEKMSQEESKEQTSIEAVTPKSNSTRCKTENLNSSIASNCNESFSSETSTPRRSGRNISKTNSQEDLSLNDSTNTNLTPKQLQKKLEFAKKKDEREKERLEREKKRQLEKEERARQRQEKEDQKRREREEKEEAKRKEREEKEEQKRKEREEKEKQKELEKKLREEKEEQKRKEKEEKEEQRKKEKEAKDEEKRKKQEALEQEKLEQEQKKKKAAEAFVSFFVPKQKAEKDQVTGPISKHTLLSSFTLKSDMRLAPITRNSLDEQKRMVLDEALVEQNIPKNSLYIKNLKNGVHKPLGGGRTWPMSDKDDDIMIIEDELPPVDVADEIICDTAKREKLRPKLLAFHENRRPPYWGTWRKKSSSINPRRPFQTDKKHLDYEVDSDEEWEEEQDGESIDGSVANSDDEQEADEYEVDNEVFVPHGYLSDEEATMDEDDVLSLSPESQKARLKHLEDEFESELKKPMEKLKPRLYGLLWETTDGGKPEKCLDALWNYFGKLSMIMNDPTPLLQPSTETEETEKKKTKKKKDEQISPKSEKKKKKEDKEVKKPKADKKQEKKNQPGINTFLKKITT